MTTTNFRNTNERFGATTTTYAAISPEALATDANHLFTDGAEQEWIALDESDEDKDTFCTCRALQLRAEFIAGLEIVAVDGVESRVLPGS